MPAQQAQPGKHESITADGFLNGPDFTSSSLADVLPAALERQLLCSGDPICADHDPATSADDRALHGAACHGCLVIAETSCEARNLFLDRALLVDTVAAFSHWVLPQLIEACQGSVRIAGAATRSGISSAPACAWPRRAVVARPLPSRTAGRQAAPARERSAGKTNRARMWTSDSHP